MDTARVDDDFLRPPPHVRTAEQLERWSMCRGLVLKLWELYGEGPIDPEWAWMQLRSIYNSNVPTYLPGEREGAFAADVGASGEPGSEAKPQRP